MEYLVKWEINVDGDNPQEAAKAAQAIQRDHQSTANVFDVTNEESGHTIEVDLDEEEFEENMLQMHYQCTHCGHEWTMAHTVGCNDRCPTCRQETEPSSIEDA